MVEKWADKMTKIFSKKAVENTKKAITEDIEKNKTGYAMSAITGLVIAVGVVTIIKMVIGAPTAPSVSYTYNFYLTPDKAESLANAVIPTKMSDI